MLPSMVGARIRIACLLLASLIVILIGQAGRELVAPDDLREVEVAREMYKGGDYIVPRLAGLPFIEKPSGFQAAVAVVYRIVGEPSASAARFTAAAFALLSLVAVLLLGWRILGIEGGALTVALLAFSERFCRAAHNVLLDNALTAAVAFTVLLTWIGLQAADVRKKRLAYAAAGFSLGVSFLFKGFVGPAVFASGFLLYLIIGRRFGEIRHILRPLSVIAFLVPVLAWVVPFLLSAPLHLVREFFIQNHFGRFIHGYDSHKGPVYFYPFIVWLEFAPGSIFLPLAIWMAWKTRKEGENRAGIFFLSLFVGPLLLLSASSAKDYVYFLPVYPALAMLVAWCIVRGWSSPSRAAKILTWIMTATAIVFAVSLLGMTGIREGLTLPVAAAAVTFGLGVAGCLFYIRRNNFRWTSAYIGLVFALGWSLWFTGPVAKADVARRSIRRPVLQALSRAGNRDILLYKPTDGLRGAASFYRDRTAQEMRTPVALIERLADNPNQTVALICWIDKDAVPPELDKAAQSVGRDLQIEASFRLGKKYLLLVSAGGAGREAEGTGRLGRRAELLTEVIFR
ncbi:MAG TPA: glycosyltransferase family 39 protein [Thermodesulfobacteriota bacterium]|nr:glycosyltransferase family 39 protein [Thermodesulfobacteriota bacterium]